MSELVTIDGFLARHPDGEGFTLAIDEATVGKDAVDALAAHVSIVGGVDVPQWETIGRSALGIVTGIDIEQANREIAHEDGALHVPINVTAHAELGQQLLPRLQELVDGHRPGELLRWDRHRLPFGRLIQRGMLAQLTDEELEYAFDEYLFATGEYPDTKGDVQIENNTVSLPLEPWELLPNTASLGGVDGLWPMIQEGPSGGRTFAFRHMYTEPRDAGHNISGFTVGSALLSPGPFYGRVVEVVSSNGSLPQLPSAAWLDANRSPGLHSEQKHVQMGRQVEVLNKNPDEVHPWQDARVVVELFCPKENLGQAELDFWTSMSVEERQDQHYLGYGFGV